MRPLMHAPSAAAEGIDRTAFLALSAMALCFGGTWVAASVAVDAIPPLAIATARFALATVLLYAWTRVSHRPLAPLRRRDLPAYLAMGLTAIAGYNVLFLVGLTLAPASDGAIIVPGMAPVFTTILATLLLRERMGLVAATGLGISIGGLLLVVGPAGNDSPTRLAGDLLFVVGALFWAAYNIVSRATAGRFDAVSATFYGTAAGTVVLVPAAVGEGGFPSLLAAPVAALAGVAYLAVFGTVAAFVLLQVGLRRIGAARASTFALLVPVVGVLSSAWLLGEPLAPSTLVGGAVVLVGLWLVQRPAGRRLPSIRTRPARARRLRDRILGA